MKKIILSLVLLSCMLLPAPRANAQIIDAVLQAIRKAILAIDAQVQRQQTKVIWLQNAQKELENILSKTKLGEISEWTEKQRKLYDDYFKELWKVKNAISTYNRIKDIIQRQQQLVSEYKRAWGLLKGDGHFTAKELSEMYQVYTGILDESLKNLDQLILVTNSFATQMSDGKRLELIRTAGDAIDQNLTDIRMFNSRNFNISISRAQSRQQADVLKKLYGL